MKFISVLVSLLAADATAFVVTPPTTTRALVTQLAMRTTSDEAEDAIREAEAICHNEGPQSEACRVAWDIVEEIEASDSRRRSGMYRDEFRDGTYDPAREMARDLDMERRRDIRTVMEGFDILSDQLSEKLDRMVATTDRLQDLGADAPVVDELGARAVEMKRLMADVHRYLDEY